MDILFYIILFGIGAVIGNYLSTRAEEIPQNLELKKKYYTSKKTNDKLVSKITYIILCGLLAIILANILRLNIHEFDLSTIIIYIFSIIYISILILIGGIDKLYVKIEKQVLVYGILISITYMLYLCIVDLGSIMVNLMYLTIYIVLLVIDSILLKKHATDSYILNILLEICLILAFTDIKTLLCTTFLAFIAIVLYILAMKYRNRKNGNRRLKLNEIPIGYFLATSNIIVLLMIRILEKYYIYYI